MVTPEPTTSVSVPRSRLSASGVPQVCFKSGEPAQCLIPTIASATPSWAWVLIIPGGVPFLVARRWLFPREPLALPARTLVADRWQLVRRGIAGCYAVAVVVTLWAVATLNPLGLLAGAFVGAATTGGWLLLTPKLWVAAEVRGEQIVLFGVHATAARALGGR